MVMQGFVCLTIPNCRKRYILLIANPSNPIFFLNTKHISPIRSSCHWGRELLSERGDPDELFTGVNCIGII